MSASKKPTAGKTTEKRTNPFSKYSTVKGISKAAALVRRVSRIMEKPTSQSLKSNIGMVAKKGECRGLTVISANLWHDFPRYRGALERLEAFADLVEEYQADILLLQEVSRTNNLRVDEWLSQRLGMNSVYSRANGGLDAIGFEEGPAILSRYPLSQPVLNQLNPGTNRFSYRLALGSQVDTPCGSLMAFSVHLGISPKENARQVNKLHSWVQGMAATLPALVGGDFNAGEHSGAIKSLRQKWMDTFRHLNPLADGTTHEIHWPWGKPLRRSRLDYIFLKAEQAQWKLLESLHLDAPGQRHSDHRAVLLRLVPAYARISAEN